MSRSPSTHFQSFVDTHELQPLYPLGSPFTWTNRQKQSSHTQERLDWCLSNTDWDANFPNPRLCHGDFFGSDHRPLILTLHHPADQSKHVPRFIFDRLWMSEPGFEDCLRDAWTLNNHTHHSNSLTGFNEKLYNCSSRLKQRKQSLGPPLTTQICEKEEEYWQQRSHVAWLQLGDKNTRYLHRVAFMRCQTNKILSLQCSNGSTANDTTSILTTIEHYFAHMFQSQSPGDDIIDFVLSGITECLTEEEIELLQATFSANEIKKATFQLSHDKAPGLDGFSDCFFQKNWHLLGKDINTAPQSFLNGDADLAAIKKTLIVLIPKRPNPEKITDYRPISLWSTFYKIISRILVNRLKPILSRIISPSQSAFLPNRLISDNIIIGQEVMHSLSHRKSGRLGWMALKLDMAKAFDRVEWVFVRRVMEKFSFPQRFINLVMACVSTATFSFSINQQVLGHLKPSRGIRQGDALSLYLFLSCSEGLSSLIHLKTQQRQPRIQSLGIKIARRAPTISHLFFVDDSLLFSSASLEAATVIKQILHDYSLASGQLVNFTKSALFFSPNTIVEIQNTVATILGIPIRDIMDKYLSLPQTFGRTKKDAFNYIKDRVWSHLNKWNSKLFSKGGLGFRSMKAFNQAMLGKQAWQLLQYPHSLVATLLKSRYFPHSSFLNSGKGHRPSLVWSSITWGKELLQSGLRRSIGDGTTISIFNNAWIPGYGKLHYLRHHSDANMTVSDLLTPTKEWNLALLQATFPEDVSQAILTIPLTNISTPDAYYWSLTPHGTYTVNSGYHQAHSQIHQNDPTPSDAHSQIHQNDPTPSDNKPSQTWWKQLWTLPLPPKLKHFLWRACHDILLTNHNLFKWKTLHSPHCCRCHYHDETLEHALSRCPAVQEIWNCMNSWLHAGFSSSPAQVLRECTICSYLQPTAFSGCRSRYTTQQNGFCDEISLVTKWVSLNAFNKLSLGDARAYHLSTAKNELGVVSAESAACATMVPVSWTEMQCPLTGQIEQRKVAKFGG
uniref:Reverse transcriptase domain-containing protein n=1 Tax=Cannabis sativa TaxID=3483 RepID=A0A803PU32_CANSA